MKAMNLICLLGLWLGVLQTFSLQANEKVYIIPIEENIAPKIRRETNRSLRDAVKKEADLVLIKMNTYGGYVVDADSMRSAILDCPIPVIVYINKNAASAGALISIACDSIYMSPASSFGAATVVSSSGEKAPDKYQSYMRAMIRSTAEAQGKIDKIIENDTISVWRRNPILAEAMVDERIAVDGIIDTGQILTFTASEAVKNGYCEGIFESQEELLNTLGYADCEIIEYKRTWLDDVIGFLIDPIVQGILILIILGGIYFELQTPGIGFPSAAAIFALFLYFFPLYIEGIASQWEIILFVIGVILLTLEIFVIPGFGVAGISGIICIIISLIFAPVEPFSFEYVGDYLPQILSSASVVIIIITLLMLVILIFGANLITSNKFNIALHSTQEKEAGFISGDKQLNKFIGKEGIALTQLKPSGKIKIDGMVYDALSLNGQYIEKGQVVKIKKYQAGILGVVLF